MRFRFKWVEIVRKVRIPSRIFDLEIRISFLQIRATILRFVTGGAGLCVSRDEEWVPRNGSGALPGIVRGKEEVAN